MAKPLKLRQKRFWRLRTGHAASTCPYSLNRSLSTWNAVKVQGFKVLGFRVQGSGLRAQGSGFGAQDSGFRGRGSGFRT